MPCHVDCVEYRRHATGGHQDGPGHSPASVWRDDARSVVCSTGQHRELLDQVFALFGIVPDIELRVMQPNQSLSALTARLLTALDATIEQVKPDWVLAQGDTTTVLTAALVAFYHRIKFGHVEAGLRTGDRYQPFPEEVNRKAADAIAELMFAPTDSAGRTCWARAIPTRGSW